MDPLVFIVTAIPSVEELTNAMAESFDGSTSISFSVASSETGADPEDYMTLRIAKIFELRFKKRSNGAVVYFKGLTGSSEASTPGRFVQGLALNPKTQEGEIFVTDLMR